MRGTDHTTSDDDWHCSSPSCNRPLADHLVSLGDRNNRAAGVTKAGGDTPKKRAS